jgi:hypothetical protein
LYFPESSFVLDLHKNLKHANYYYRYFSVPVAVRIVFKLLKKKYISRSCVLNRYCSVKCACVTGPLKKQSLEPKNFVKSETLLISGAASSCLRGLLAEDGEADESFIVVPEADGAEADALGSLLTFNRQ